MAFRKLRGVRLPEEKQGLIRYTCLTYKHQDKRTKEKIQRLCEKCGGAYSAALFAMVTTRESVTKISLAYAISESALYRLRKQFYEAW